jgi:hypothetical protein
MRQQVVVTTDAPAALKPLLASAIQAELRMLELGLARIAERLQAFEKQYSLTSEEFEHRFATGEIGRLCTISNGSERSRPPVVLRGNGKPCRKPPCIDRGLFPDAWA